MVRDEDWTGGCSTSTTNRSYDTSGTDQIESVRTSRYCTVITYVSSNTMTEHERMMRQKLEDQEYWANYFERVERQEEFKELSDIERRIKRKVALPIVSQNAINKTMNRRMMNGRH